MKPLKTTRCPRRLRIFLASTLLFAAFGAASSLAPAPAFAQSDEQIEQAKEKFLDGQQAYQDEDFDTAAKHFLSAYELSERAELLYNVGRSYRNAGKLVKAQDYLQQYINAMPEAANADEVIEAIIEIQQDMAAQIASVQVTASQPELKVYVSDETEARCELPCALSLMPGEHTLSVRLPDAEVLTKKITLKAEEQTSVHFDTPGRLQVRSDQRAGSVEIAGIGQYTLPMDSPISLSSGAHQLTVTGPHGAHWSGSVEVTSGELSEISIPMTSTIPAPNADRGGTSTLRTVSFALAGLAVGLGAGGALMGMQASDTHDTLGQRQSALGSVDPAMLDQGRSQQLGANILYAASAASLLAGAGVFTWDLLSGDSEEIPPSEPAPQREPEPADDDLLGL